MRPRSTLRASEDLDSLPADIAPAAASAATSVAPDHPGVIARPPRIAYLFLGLGATLGWLWPLPLLPAGSPAA